MRRHELVGVASRVLGRQRTRLDVLRPMAPLGAVGPGQGLIESSSSSAAGDQVAQLAKQIADLRTVQQTHADTTAANTLALLQNTLTKASGGSVAGTIGGFASSFLGGGGFLSPILSGILGLFGGGGAKSAPPPLVPFQLPAPIQYEGALTGSGQVTAVDHNPSGAPRSVASIAPTPQVNIQVNAMDSRSFLDHSDEIARAVRQAILQSSPLNDVIAEL